MISLERVRKTLRGEEVDHLPPRELIDMVGEDSIQWIDNQGPVVDESRAFLGGDVTKLRTLKVPDPLGGGRLLDRIRGIEQLRRRAGSDVSVVGWIEGPLSLSSELRGLNNLMEDLILEPQFVGDLMDFVVEVEVAFARAQLDAGADTIGMGESATCRRRRSPEMSSDSVSGSCCAA
jgi:uroporphyrinogen-III decarboxylase